MASFNSKSTEMTPSHCLICYKPVSNSDPFGYSNLGADTLTRHLRVMFVLQKVLNLESINLVNFLTNHPDVDQWIRLCSDCTAQVVTCETLFHQLLEISKKFEKSKQEIVNSLKESGPRTRIKRGDTPEVFNVTEQTRCFVLEKSNYLILTTVNYFNYKQIMKT